MKKAKILTGILMALAAITLVTACSNSDNPETPSEPETSLAQPGVPSEPETSLAQPGVPSEPETSLAQPGIPSEPETSLVLPETTPAEPTEEPTEEAVQLQAAEFIGKTIGELEEAYHTELADAHAGYMGCFVFEYVGEELPFVPMTAKVEDNYKDSVIAAIFTNQPCPLYGDISGCMSYNQIAEAAGDIGEPEVSELDGSVGMSFVYDGYRFLVSWSDYTGFDSPCYSITVDKNV